MAVTRRRKRTRRTGGMIAQCHQYMLICGMPRTARNAPGGLVYHGWNRAVARLPLFEKEADYEAFERVLHEAHQRTPIRILAYCWMPNHWHFVLWPKASRYIVAPSARDDLDAI